MDIENVDQLQSTQHLSYFFRVTWDCWRSYSHWSIFLL